MNTSEYCIVKWEKIQGLNEFSLTMLQITIEELQWEETGIYHKEALKKQVKKFLEFIK